MANLDSVGFKFNIGDIVAMKGSATVTVMQDAPWTQNNGWRFLILERLAQECPGGVQLHYRVRPFKASGECVTSLIQHLEEELEASEAFRNLTAEEIAEQDRKRIAEAAEAKARRDAAREANK